MNDNIPPPKPYANTIKKNIPWNFQHCETYKPAEYSDNISAQSPLRCGDETHKNVEAFAEHVFSL